MNSRKSLNIGLAPDALLSCLAKVPFLNVEAIEIQRNVALGEFQADLTALLKFPFGNRKLICEVGAKGHPRLAREAIHKLSRLTEMLPKSYGVFIAPYISAKSADICTKSNIGYVDFSGHCRLAFGYVYIEQTGYPNMHAEDQGLASLFSPKSERVLRVLFEDTHKKWSTNKLAYEAEVSVGKSSNVRKLLRDNEYIEEGSGGFTLSDPMRLLLEWQKKYEFKKHCIEEFYSFDSVPEIEAKLAEVCARKNIEYAFTGFSGAARYAPHVNYQKAMVYVDVPKNQAGPITHDIGLKRVGSGGKIDLVIPYEDGVIYGSKNIGGVKTASPIQVYLDLKNLAGRGEEAADFLLEEVIKPRW